MQVVHPQSQAIIDIDILTDFEKNDETELIELTDSFKRRLKTEYNIQVDEMFMSVILEELNVTALKYLDLLLSDITFDLSEIDSKEEVELYVTTRIPFAPMPDMAMQAVLSTTAYEQM